MKKSILQLMILCMGILWGTSSCSHDNAPNIPQKGIVINIEKDGDLKNVELQNVQVKLVNVNNEAQSYTFTPKVENNAFRLDVSEGIYNITVQATAHLPGADKAVSVYSYLRNVEVQSGEKQVTAKFEISKVSDFVFSELFVVGSKAPDGKDYRQSKYFVIYNNSDRVLYADSLVLCETEFMSSMRRQDLSPTIFDSDVPVGVVYKIPGSGKEYPIKPGEQIVIADIAKNHSAIQPNYPDLSKADFEWYDDNKLDEDIPTVKNLIKIYSYSKSVWTPHNLGSRSYVLAKLKVSQEDFLKNYKYSYTYNVNSAGTVKQMKGDGYKIPNDWIVDAVNHSIKNNYFWDIMSKTLDRGYTYINETDKDRNRDKAVIRKITETKGRHKIYQDTNNSTEDFEIKKPSMVK